MAPAQQRLTTHSRLIVVIFFLMCGGFVLTSLSTYYVSRAEIRDAIINTELPLTADNIYSEIQKDLVRPTLIASMMARDTFLRDWVLVGERNTPQMTHYLNEIRNHYGATSSFFVSDRTHAYYSTRGILRKVNDQDPRDAWYARVRSMKETHEINVDSDEPPPGAMSITINHRVLDYNGNFIGVTGVSLSADTVTRLVDEYQKRYGRNILLTDAEGKIILRGKAPRNAGGQSAPASDIFKTPGLRDIAPAILKASSASFEYTNDGERHFINVRALPELKWFLIVDKPAHQAYSAVQRSLLINLLLCLTTTMIVLGIVHLALLRHQQQLEVIATTDRLTGLANRRALDVLLKQKIHEASRQKTPLTAILIDIDHFRTINDTRGQLAGDRILSEIAQTLRNNLRASDVACRWGGEEFLISLADTDLEAATQVACTLREKIENSLYFFENEALRVSVSAGVSLFRTGETVDDFVARAEAMLQRAKEEGRNRVCREPIESN
ncbi:sensor domain-containing diguanylate cyclase [Propionivibrio dicarboxylicus]|uniref:diguanylate cyclase n=1 Tax=Propionivibrio dicarboxylicus TaxID=83767 RepID=A0A1G7Y6A7_9RHOO|nr:sensor domain-containing diguanylate cyclase [Propionivibrio dicarboxylicus]SDG91520.1 diguanylate cyclase (GGDEF) domain-containing protein [Propionivibrio dicarboxylicus]